MEKSALDWIAYVLVIIGAVNWGLVGLLDLNLVTKISTETLGKVIYTLVGLSGLWMIYLLSKEE